mmetsp:Transcript_60391/g.126387  ORF Transcript_60391/g.126387 Transcript_60391/m.126387 type:complete len:295 (+) Transcript_60391:1560-2444(+)
MREEIISSEEAKEHEVIDHLLLIVYHGEKKWDAAKLEIQVLANDIDLNELEWGAADCRTALICLAEAQHSLLIIVLLPKLLCCQPCPPRIQIKLTKNGKVWLMRGQRKHDEVCIFAVYGVPRVRIVSWLLALQSNVFHHFVLALSGHARIRQDDFDILPACIVGKAVVNVVAKVLGQRVHEWGARRNHIVVPRRRFFRRQFPALLLPLRSEAFHFLTLVFDLFGGSVPPRTLLVHLGSGRNPVDSHVNHFARADDVEDAINVLKDGQIHLFLTRWRRKILRVTSRVNDPVHIQI